MATTINQVFEGSDRKRKSIWSSIKGLASESYGYVAKVTNEHVTPAISKGATATIVAIDRGCGVMVEGTHKFLNKYDNVALALQPEMLLRMAAIKAYERKFNEQASPVTMAAATTQQ